MNKKRIIISTLIFLLIVILFIIGMVLLKTRPPFLGEIKDLVVNTKNSIIVKTSKEYKNLKKSDKSKKYYKNEKDIKIPILLYHKIPTEKSERKEYYMNTTSTQFEKQISGLKDLGYTFITYDDLIKYNNNELALPEYVVLITFDDGYLDNYENAFPIIKRLNIPVTMFVIDNCVGAPGYFSWEQAKEMEDSGLVTIYTHGKTHIPYGNESAEVVNDYISYAHSNLEQQLGHSTNKVFAYPYGSCSDISIETLSSLGFVQNILCEQYNTSNTLNLNSLTRIFAKQNYNIETILKLILL